MLFRKQMMINATKSKETAKNMDPAGIIQHASQDRLDFDTDKCSECQTNSYV